jgi:hypothetical protein
LPACAAPDDVRHWFDLETMLTLPEPAVIFVDAADAVHQYPTRLARGRGRFTTWYAIRGQIVLQASPETVAAFSRLRPAVTSPSKPCGCAKR